MQENLISKKELLDETGISYGQLYRWKRKNLIPEEWFIRKSTFTGQETFFPRERILARIHRIMSMKDERSLDEIADSFGPNRGMTFSIHDIEQGDVITKLAWNFYIDQNPEQTKLSFDELLYLYVFDQLLQDGLITLAEGPIVFGVLRDHAAKFSVQSYSLLFVRKLGVSTCLLTADAEGVFFESNTKLVANLNVGACMEELQLKLVRLEG